MAKYMGGLFSSRVSQAEREFDVSGSPDAQLRVGHARDLIVWLTKSLAGSLIHISQRLPVVEIGRPCQGCSLGIYFIACTARDWRKESLHTGSHLRRRMSSKPVLHNAMDFEPKGHANHGDCRQVMVHSSSL
ncbi:unnamed protein product [Strongylus vulgaris]|uniref:Uncharacterized protein n=1 Tax=Strongylus vulgaris TaxID=40348 RepID=A0A3P7KBE2_STRVU|nr:unnamed protein product [Strongylus vulgaris]